MSTSIRYIIIVSALCLLSLSACAQASSLSEYQDKLDLLEEQFLSHELASFGDTLDAAHAVHAYEIPRYELTFYDAVRAFESGRYEVGLSKISQLETMLMIDSGWLECSHQEAAEFLDAPEAEEVVAIMCAEMYLSYYDNPTEETVRQISKYWALSRMALKRYARSD